MSSCLKRNVLIRDRYDELMVEQYLLPSETIKSFLKAHGNYHPLPELIKDTFYAFYKYNPTFVDLREVYPIYRVNRAIIEKIMKSEKYNQIRRFTKLNELNSALATIFFLESIAELIEEFKKISKNCRSDVREFVKSCCKKIEKASFCSCLQKVLQNLEDFSGALSSIGWGTGTGSFYAVDPQKRLQLAEKLLKNKKVIEITKLLGKYRNFAALTHKNKIKMQSQEIYETSLGNDLLHLLPHEYSIMNDEDLNVLFLKNYVERKLQQYDLRTDKTKNRGDFIVCLDLSGSMSGEPEVWAKAVALATLEIATRENRSWILIPFDYEVHRDYIYKFDRKHKPTLEDIISIAEMVFGGGTNFEEPLVVAMDMIKDVPNGDVLFISDGYCDVSDEFLEKLLKWKEKTKTKIVSVAIDARPSESLMKISDRVFEIDAFTDSYAREVFQAVV